MFYIHKKTHNAETPALDSTSNLDSMKQVRVLEDDSVSSLLCLIAQKVGVFDQLITANQQNRQTSPYLAISPRI